MPLTLPQMVMVLSEPQSLSDLKRYFLGIGGAAYTGGQFEIFGGGGDRPEAADSITVEDLIAVQLLSVRVPPQRILDLLDGQLGRRLEVELARIAVDVELDSEEALPLIKPGGHAAEAWRVLRQAGIGPVTSGKLLARKRPKLVPVYDSVVACALGTGARFWEWLHGRLREENSLLPRRLRELHERAELPVQVSPIRVLDVVLWIRHRDSHLRRGCPGLDLPS